MGRSSSTRMGASSSRVCSPAFLGLSALAFLGAAFFTPAALGLGAAFFFFSPAVAGATAVWAVSS